MTFWCDVIHVPHDDATAKQQNQHIVSHRIVANHLSISVVCMTIAVAAASAGTVVATVDLWSPSLILSRFLTFTHIASCSSANICVRFIRR